RILCLAKRSTSSR
ncbi:hypothetical protein D030_2253B, partial [Vibrio parahaemolyticus AQ3810]